MKILSSFWIKIKTSGSAPYCIDHSFPCWEEAGFSQNDTQNKEEKQWQQPCLGPCMVK